MPDLNDFYAFKMTSSAVVVREGAKIIIQLVERDVAQR